MFKYNEEKILKDVNEYIESTYSQHYVRGNDIQVNDLIMAIGHGEGSYISNAIEYLARYGKKDGRNVKDLYKAIHNIILLIHLNHTNIEQDILTKLEEESAKYKSYINENSNADELNHPKQLDLYGLMYNPKSNTGS